MLTAVYECLFVQTVLRLSAGRRLRLWEVQSSSAQGRAACWDKLLHCLIRLPKTVACWIT